MDRIPYPSWGSGDVDLTQIMGPGRNRPELSYGTPHFDVEPIPVRRRVPEMPI